MNAVRLQPGSVFAGDYRVLRPLGAGGMGAVYVVEQRSTGARRALKLMLPSLAEDPDARRRFDREARALPPSSRAITSCRCSRPASTTRRARRGS